MRDIVVAVRCVVTCMAYVSRVCACVRFNKDKWTVTVPEPVGHCGASRDEII